jgi:hypothetical protein
LPIEMRVDRAAGVRYSTAFGVVTGREFFDTYATMAGAPDNDPTLNHLADFSNVSSFDVSPEVLQRTAEAIAARIDGALAKATVGPKVAAVAPSDAVFGLLRMYQSYRELQRSPVRFRVCRTMEEAREWLGLTTG